jgi:hypothetical protein
MNVNSFNKLRLNEKVDLLNQVYQSDKFSQIIASVNFRHLNIRDKFVWLVFRQRIPVFTLFLGKLFSIIRKVKYK